MREPIRGGKVDSLTTVIAIGETGMERTGESEDEFSWLLNGAVDGHTTVEEDLWAELECHAVEEVGLVTEAFHHCPPQDFFECLGIFTRDTIPLLPRRGGE